MAKVVVGEFSMEGSSVSGPKAFMEEMGFEVMKKIERGESAVFNYGCNMIGRPGGSPSLEALVLVVLQTAYAGWKGSKSLMMKGGK